MNCIWYKVRVKFSPPPTPIVSEPFAEMTIFPSPTFRITLGVQHSLHCSVHSSPLLRCEPSGRREHELFPDLNESYYFFSPLLSCNSFLVLCSFTQNMYRSIFWKFLPEEGWGNLCFPSLRNHSPMLPVLSSVYK